MKRWLFLWGLVGLLVVLGGCRSAATPAPEPAATPVSPTAPPEEEGGNEMFGLSSTAFAAGETIPTRYTCDGEDVSPPLEWGEPPTGTQSFALVMDDPDAPMGTWVHWVLFDLPPEARSLPEAVPAQGTLPDGSRHGQNSWGRSDYGGPCPPRGTHRYYFRLYALDTRLGLDVGASKEEVLRAMEGHILAQAELMGTYSR